MHRNSLSTHKYDQSPQHCRRNRVGLFTLAHTSCYRTSHLAVLPHSPLLHPVHHLICRLTCQTAAGGRRGVHERGAADRICSVDAAADVVGDAPRDRSGLPAQCSQLQPVTTNGKPRHWHVLQDTSVEVAADLGGAAVQKGWEAQELRPGSR